MATERRVKRLQQLILETAAQYVQRELRDPRIGMVSITRVKLAKDLSSAVIGWSLLGEDGARRACERGLEDATPAVQRAIAQSLQTRTTPKISFRYDKSLQEAQALEEIFESIRQEKIEHGELDPDEGDEASGGDVPEDTTP